MIKTVKSIIALLTIAIVLSIFGNVDGIIVKAFSPLEIHAVGRVYVVHSPQLRIKNGEYVLDGIDELVERIYLDTLVNPTDADLRFVPCEKGNFCFTKEKKGRKIDKIRLKTEIAYALDSGNRIVVAKELPIYPDKTVDYCKQETVLRASFSTDYSASSAPRKHNIELACESLNGSIIDLYGDFSFNDCVGERSEARGYKVAKIISDGRFADGLGGGVCQVSTTLYNAALRAGLTITECHRHSLAVSYVPPSFDAMVSGKYCDLRLKNPTDRRMYIKAIADGERITVYIFGIKDDYTYKFRSEIEEVIPAKTRKGDKTKGETRVTPKDGLKSSAFVDVFHNGKKISSRKIRSDIYAPIEGVEIE